MLDIQRIKKAIGHLKRMGTIDKQQDLVDKLGYNKTYISGLLNDKVELSSKFVEKFAECFSDFNREWLISGEGKMLNVGANVIGNDAKPLDINLFIQVPMITIEAQAGYMLGYGDVEFVGDLPTFPVIADREFRGKYRVFEVKGDSMDDGTDRSIRNGDMILCREVKKELWANKLHIKDWNFIIVSREDGITVKNITEHNVEQGIIKCHPYNPLYDEFEIHLDEVAELYNVVSIVYRQIKL